MLASPGSSADPPDLPARTRKQAGDTDPGVLILNYRFRSDREDLSEWVENSSKKQVRSGGIRRQRMNWAVC